MAATDRNESNGVTVRLDEGLLANPGRLTRLGCSLVKSGEGAKAVALAEWLQQARPEDPEVAHAARTILSFDVPTWHGQMLNDQARNEAYARAIARAVRPGMRVLDIGAGSGLLAMMAARAGAAEVISCEVDTALAKTAQSIVATNGYGDRIRVLAKHSVDLDGDRDMGGKADMIITETFSDDLLTEGALRSLAHAKAELAKPGATVLPSGAKVRVALASHPSEPGWALGDVAGFDLSLFARHAPLHRRMMPDNKKLVLKSDPADLFEFDFAGEIRAGQHHAQVDLVSHGGDVNGIVQWIRLELDDQNAYENMPGKPSCWGVFFHPFARALRTEAGERVPIAAGHDNDRLRLWSMNIARS